MTDSPGVFLAGCGNSELWLHSKEFERVALEIDIEGFGGRWIE